MLGKSLGLKCLYIWLVLMAVAVMPVWADVTYSGRAFGAYVNLPTLGIGPRHISDTGPLPPGGGYLSEALLSFEVLTVLQANVLVAKTSGANGVAASSASLADLVVLPNHPAQLTASFVRAESEANCNGTRGAFEVVELTFGGVEVSVDPFLPNQVVEIPGVAKLIINEQQVNSGSGFQEITVNALHLILATGDEVILSSAHSDIRGCPGCPPPIACHDFVTGGGWIKVGNGKANFGFNAGFKPGSSAPEVHFNYIDHTTGMHMKATGISTYKVGSTSLSRVFEGTAEINGIGGWTYVIEVADNGEPGRADKLSIRLSNGYSAGGTLAGGNIQLHKPCP